MNYNVVLGWGVFYWRCWICFLNLLLKTGNKYTFLLNVIPVKKNLLPHMKTLINFSVYIFWILIIIKGEKWHTSLNRYLKYYFHRLDYYGYLPGVLLANDGWWLVCIFRLHCDWLIVLTSNATTGCLWFGKRTAIAPCRQIYG